MAASDSGQLEHRESHVKQAAAFLIKVRLKKRRYKNTHGMSPNDAVRKNMYFKRRVRIAKGILPHDDVFFFCRRAANYRIFR